MPTLIILRLHPVAPVDSATFASFVNGLTIRAFDLSFADSVAGLDIGSASGAAGCVPATGGSRVGTRRIT